MVKHTFGVLNSVLRPRLIKVSQFSRVKLLPFILDLWRDAGKIFLVSFETKSV